MRHNIKVKRCVRSAGKICTGNTNCLCGKNASNDLMSLLSFLSYFHVKRIQSPDTFTHDDESCVNQLVRLLNDQNIPHLSDTHRYLQKIAKERVHMSV